MIAAVFDTETTGLIDNHVLKLDRQPEVVEFACVMVRDWEERVSEYQTLIRPRVWPIATEVREKGALRLSDEELERQPSFSQVAQDIERVLSSADAVVAHNLSFDMEMIDIEFERLGRKLAWPSIKICTVEQSIFFVGGRLNLTDLLFKLTQREHRGAHRAMADVLATVDCLAEMKRRGWL